MRTLVSVLALLFATAAIADDAAPVAAPEVPAVEESAPASTAPAEETVAPATTPSEVAPAAPSTEVHE